MMTGSPFTGMMRQIHPEDLERLGNYFARVVKNHISCDFVSFIDPLRQNGSSGSDQNPEEHTWNKVVSLEQPQVNLSTRKVFLPFYNGKELFTVAIIEGVDLLKLTSTPTQLSEKWNRISEEMLDCKQLFVDPVSGALNGNHLRDELLRLLNDAQPVDQKQDKSQEENIPSQAVLVLIELFLEAKDCEQAYNNISRAASCLESLVDRSALHHLGSGLYGLIWERISLEELNKLGDAVLHWLKRENYPKVHIGFAPFKLGGGGGEETVEHYLGLAWEALRIARRRGPLAHCSSVTLVNRDHHPFKQLPAELLDSLQKIWRGKKRFAIILLQQDQETPGKHFSRRVCSLIEKEHPILSINARESYVFLDGAEKEDALHWARNFTKKLKKGMEVTFSIGIGLYPCKGFNKSDIPMNCRKALLHTKFFGPNTMTVFDSVSLNISGDIYYNEGDLPRALKEYRKGLKLNNNNVNLLNSMGVTCAQMNQFRKAISYFEKAIAIDSANFMAHFNLGFVLLTLGEQNKAIKNFENALESDDKNIDLIVQLGKLYCQAGRYQEAAAILEKGDVLADKEDRDVGHGGLHRLLGEAYKGMGRNRKAMTRLQKAISCNPQDAAALSHLGELYELEKQGGGIALALCLQAVELDDSQWEYWHRLGRVQYEQDDFGEALHSLQRSLKLNRKNPKSLALLALVYQGLGKNSMAEKMIERSRRLAPSSAKGRRPMPEIAMTGT